MARQKEDREQVESIGKVRLCTVPEMPVRALAAGVGDMRASLVRITEKKWVNGTVLHYCFLDEPALWRGAEEQKQAVRDAFAAWKQLGLGLEFAEVHDPREAEIRVGFDQGGGSWSYVGRDNIDYARDPAERTMNFGWDLTTAYGRDTALHEVGHALGFSHEHQNPKSGIEWNERAVLDYFAGAPNYWAEEQTRHNILRKLSLGESDGSEWDKDSIMHYQFPAGLIVKPEEYQGNPLIPAPGLSRPDIAEALRFYPALAPAQPELRPYETQRLRLQPGEQVNFIIEPRYSRKYSMQTFGQIDSVMVLFELVDGQPVYFAGDDDSGTDLNARIDVRLVRGRHYMLRVRLYYAEQSGEGAVMLW